MKVLNLTQHQATPEQVAAGVIDLDGEQKERLVALLTFEELPTSEEILSRVEGIVSIMMEGNFVTAMIGGAPFLMGPLERRLKEVGVQPLYAFSRRESVEETLPDGSVRKTNVFRHVGFVEGAL